MAALAAAALGGSLISAGATVGASIGAAEIQKNNSTQLQQNDQNFQKGLIDRGEKSFSDVGLPKFLYWSGGSLSGSLPNTQTHLGGSAYAQSYGVNSNLPYYSSNPTNQYLGMAKPRATTSSPADKALDPAVELTTPKNRYGIGFVPATTDTKATATQSGSGIRMPGGDTLMPGSPEFEAKVQAMYNTRGTQFGASSRDFSAQFDVQTRDKAQQYNQPKFSKYAQTMGVQTVDKVTNFSPRGIWAQTPVYKV